MKIKKHTEYYKRPLNCKIYRIEPCRPLVQNEKGSSITKTKTTKMINRSQSDPNKKWYTPVKSETN